MRGAILDSLNLKVWHEINLPNGDRIVDAWPLDEKHWPSCDSANRNVYRVNPNNQIVWQVRRNENGFINWDARNKNPTIINPTFTNGYRDPFANMGAQFFIRRPIDENRPHHPKFSYELFDAYAPGRLLGLSTYEFEYDLDPDTGIAVCTGIPVK